LATHPSSAQDPARCLDPALRTPVLRAIDGQGFARSDGWISGAGTPPPTYPHPPIADAMGPFLSRDTGEGLPDGTIKPLSRTAGEGGRARSARSGEGLSEILDHAYAGDTLAEADIVRLFEARGEAVERG